MMGIRELKEAMEQEGYLCEEELAVTIYLALALGKPLLVEGAPGVGKTEIAKVLARVFATDLIRLQCYEGLDENKALYEWNYQRQLLKIQIIGDKTNPQELEKDLFHRDYLLERPLLKAIQANKKIVLLLDEVDKVDEPFEAFLFEILSDFQVSIPELGTLKALHIPMVVLTSNGDRELSDGLKRRCIYLYIDYPSLEKELGILRLKVPEIGEKMTQSIAEALQYIRNHLDLQKQPSIAEAIDWAKALVALHYDTLTVDAVTDTINLLAKNHDDREILLDENHVAKMLGMIPSFQHKHVSHSNALSSKDEKNLPGEPL